MWRTGAHLTARREASWQPDCYHLFLPDSAAKDPGTSVLAQRASCQLPCSYCSPLNAPNAHGKDDWAVWHNLHSLLDNLKTWKDSLSLDSGNSLLSCSTDRKRTVVIFVSFSLHLHQLELFRGMNTTRDEHAHQHSLTNTTLCLFLWETHNVWHFLFFILMYYLCGCLLFWKGFWAIVFTVTVRTVSDHDYCMRWETKAQEAQNTVSQHIKMRWFSICYLHLCVILLHLFKPLNLQPHTHTHSHWNQFLQSCTSMWLISNPYV